MPCLLVPCLLSIWGICAAPQLQLPLVVTNHVVMEWSVVSGIISPFSVHFGCSESLEDESDAITDEIACGTFDKSEPSIDTSGSNANAEPARRNVARNTINFMVTRCG